MNVSLWSSKNGEALHRTFSFHLQSSRLNLLSQVAARQPPCTCRFRMSLHQKLDSISQHPHKRTARQKESERWTSFLTKTGKIAKVIFECFAVDAFDKKKNVMEVA